MRAWIRRFFDRTGTAGCSGPPVFIRGEGFVSGPAVFTATRERFRIVVFRGLPEDVCEDCGGPCHWLALEFLGRDDTWQPLLVVHEMNLAHIRQAVSDVADFLAIPREDADKR
jgi:hypothetical protein